MSRKQVDTVLFIILGLATLFGMIAIYGEHEGVFSIEALARVITFIGFGMIAQKKLNIY